MLMCPLMTVMQEDGFLAVALKYHHVVCRLISRHIAGERHALLEQLQQLFAEALADAGENYRNAAEVGMEVDADNESHVDRQYSIRRDIVDVNGKEYENVVEGHRLLQLIEVPAYIDNMHDLLEFRVRGNIPQDKAKMLKNRVSQYFGSPSAHTVKVRKMVENVDDFDYIIVKSEFEALVLECSLIKQHTPKYNILLKDSKTYPWICVSADEFPRTMATTVGTRHAVSTKTIRREKGYIKYLSLNEQINHDNSYRNFEEIVLYHNRTMLQQLILQSQVC